MKTETERRRRPEFRQSGNVSPANSPQFSNQEGSKGEISDTLSDHCAVTEPAGHGRRASVVAELVTRSSRSISEARGRLD